MTGARFLRWTVLAAFLLAFFGCTQGAVEDGITGEAVGGAEVNFYRWPPPQSTGYTWEWPRGFRADDPDFRTVTTGVRWRGANFGFGGSGEVTESPEDIIAPHSWYRIAIHKEGYYPGYFYRYHGGYDEECSFAVHGEDGLHAGPCNIQDFTLWPEGSTFPLLPDLIIDDREFVDREWQCALLDDHPPLFGLRIAAGTANVGMGALHLEGTEVENVEDARVYQRIDYSDGSYELIELPPGGFEFHVGHEHIHFRDWYIMDMFDSREECAHRDSRPESCHLATSGKISFCIMDLEPFDADIRADYNGYQRYPDPPTCDALIQGLSPGWKDVYASFLEGQVLILGPADESYPAKVLLEAEVDPAHQILQATRQNSFTSLSVDVPGNPAALCDDPATRVDCRGNPNEWLFSQRMQCPDYLKFAKAK